MLTKLNTLRTQLAELRRRRWSVRMATAWGAFALAMLWALSVAFVIDWSLEMSRAQRVVSLVICGGAMAWAFRRYTKPLLGYDETDLDLALVVERRQQIDSDLVAALQFETPDAAAWGSGQLKTAVIDHVAGFGNSLNVLEGVAHEQFRRRMTALAVTLGILMFGTAVSPGCLTAFLNRFLLGSAHYPSDTELVKITVNGTVINPAPFGPPKIRGAFGRPLRFEVTAGGVLPEQGEIRLTGLHSRLENILDLHSQTAAPIEGKKQYAGELPRLVDSILFQLSLGDAWTDPLVVEVIPLPVVTIDLDQTPPVYAADVKQAAAPQTGARQLSVIEGSRVDLHLTSLNKPLKSARLTIGKMNYELSTEDRHRRVWNPPADTPFARVTEPLSYEVQVEDADGLALEQPLTGYIRLQADRPPRVVAAVVTEKVLPAARPTISYGATDDFGLAALKVNIAIQRGRGEMEQIIDSVVTIPPAETKTFIRGSHVLDLKTFSLLKGDEVRVTLEAFDFRGVDGRGEPLPGKSALSEPLVFQVTDESGILAGLVEADEKSAKQLDTIIQRQLGIGEAP